MSEKHTRRRHFKVHLVTGLLVWVPVAVTFFALRLLVTFVDQSLLLIPRPYRPETILGFNIPGLGILLALAVLLVTGMLVSNLLGRTILKRVGEATRAHPARRCHL